MSIVETWLATEGDKIEKSLLHYTSTFGFYVNSHKIKYPLSDLGTCGAIHEGVVTFPKPYYVQQVYVTTPKETERIPHHVGYDGSFILDLFPGQFYRDDKLEISGIAIMLEIAPQLFHVLSKELTVLHATAKQIKNKLNLSYDLR